MPQAESERLGAMGAERMRDEGGRVVGEPRDTTIASYALSSVAAAYQSWRGVLEKYATAIQDYGGPGLSRDQINRESGSGRAYSRCLVRGRRADTRILSAREHLGADDSPARRAVSGGHG